MPAKPLTTTSYALLGLLSIQPWTGYELAQQMTRGLSVFWARAERAIYDEPKNLVLHGLATAKEEDAGRRTRTRYRITPAGRKALRAWLATPIEPPQLESEALLRLTFAHAGTVDQLAAAIASLGDAGRAMARTSGTVTEEYLADRGPFPERAHLVATTGLLLVGLAEMLVRYEAEARATVSDWSGTTADAASDATAVLEDIARRSRAILEAGAAAGD